MIKIGDDLLKTCLLLSCMPLISLSGRIAAGQQSGDRCDMSNYRGITVGCAIANLLVRGAQRFLHCMLVACRSICVTRPVRQAPRLNNVFTKRLPRTFVPVQPNLDVVYC